ncbi:hypothetical protein ACFXJ8_10145 [Nonomuraea sp. NPDC059194]|uniref:hypothetical protein n=1 Tax=Nonomuraea sp. NPDC059194 TaxID=3346764 RepID=UPI0036964938
MNPLGPSFLWRICCLLVLAVAISMAAGIRESRPTEPPFTGWIDTVEVEGRALILHAVSGMTSTDCLKADEAEAAEFETSVRVRVVLRDVCPRRERTLLEKWRDELWPRAYIGTGGVVFVPVTLDRPLGRRKVVDEAGREIRVCPIMGSRLKTMQQCLT